MTEVTPRVLRAASSPGSSVRGVLARAAAGAYRPNPSVLARATASAQQRSRACRQGRTRGDAAATLLVAAALVTVPVNDLASPTANRALLLHLCECAVIDRRHRADPFVPQCVAAAEMGWRAAARREGVVSEWSASTSAGPSHGTAWNSSRLYGSAAVCGAPPREAAYCGCARVRDSTC